MSVRKFPLTEYGIKVNTSLLKNCQTQQWLIDEIKKKLPERFIDSSLLNKILTGRVHSVVIETAIDEIIAEREAAKDEANTEQFEEVPEDVTIESPAELADGKKVS